MNEVVGHAVDVPGNADRVDEAEDEHDPEREAQKKVEHPEEVGAVQNARRGGNDVPPRVGKDFRVRLEAVYRQIV